MCASWLSNNEHYFLDMPLLFFLHCGMTIGRWNSFGFVHNVPKVHGSIINLNLQRLKFSPLSFLMTLASSSYSNAMLLWKIGDKLSNHSHQCFLSNYMHSKWLDKTSTNHYKLNVSFMDSYVALHLKPFKEAFLLLNRPFQLICIKIKCEPRMVPPFTFNSWIH